nr:MAG TPA: hypothetical protein [Caudoviricetes sp.]
MRHIIAVHNTDGETVSGCNSGIRGTHREFKVAGDKSESVAVESHGMRLLDERGFCGSESLVDGLVYLHAVNSAGSGSRVSGEVIDVTINDEAIASLDSASRGGHVGQLDSGRACGSCYLVSGSSAGGRGGSVRSVLIHVGIKRVNTSEQSITECLIIACIRYLGQVIGQRVCILVSRMQYETAVLHGRFVGVKGFRHVRDILKVCRICGRGHGLASLGDSNGKKVSVNGVGVSLHCGCYDLLRKVADIKRHLLGRYVNSYVAVSVKGYGSASLGDILRRGCACKILGDKFRGLADSDSIADLGKLARIVAVNEVSHNEVCLKHHKGFVGDYLRSEDSISHSFFPFVNYSAATFCSRRMTFLTGLLLRPAREALPLSRL